jgi:hypothetical protein
MFNKSNYQSKAIYSQSRDSIYTYNYKGVTVCVTAWFILMPFASSLSLAWF